MSSRWFVEIVPTDQAAPKPRYCVEADRWQGALKRARELRGEKGPVSRFKIEERDGGYRAVDPTTKLVYEVEPAPADAPLSVPPPEVAPREAQRSSPPKKKRSSEVRELKSVAPRVRLSDRPVSKSAQPRERITSIPLPSPSAPPRPGTPTTSAAAIPRSPHLPKFNPASSAGKKDVQDSEPRPSDSPAAEPQAQLASAAPSAPAAEAPAPAGPTGTLGEEAEAVEKPVVAPSAGVAASSKGGLQADAERRSLPSVSTIAIEQVQPPTDELPIAYYELAVTVPEGLGEPELERELMWGIERAVKKLEGFDAARFVQLALFDHAFEGRPEKPPVASLTWKDWQEHATLDLRGASRPFTLPSQLTTTRASGNAAPPAAEGALPRPDASPPRPAHEAEAPKLAVVVDEPVAPSAPPASQSEPPSSGSIRPDPIVSLGHGQRHSSRPPGVAVEASSSPSSAPKLLIEPNQEDAPAPAIIPTPVVPAGAPADAGAVEATAPKAPNQSVPLERPVQEAPSQETYRPPLPSAPLIDDLFTDMHDLQFMVDLATGVNFIQQLLLRTIPCQGVLIHVHDINARQYVVLGAHGAAADKLRFHRTADTEEFFANLQKQQGPLVCGLEQLSDAARERWRTLLGVTPTSVLCCPVHHERRYLGIIELCNPAPLSQNGASPSFTVEHHNALDYVSRQFADFVAMRPAVFEEDASGPTAP